MRPSLSVRIQINMFLNKFVKIEKNMETFESDLHWLVKMLLVK